MSHFSSISADLRLCSKMKIAGNLIKPRFPASMKKSMRLDSNQRPLRPERSALPN